ncbi:nitrous oxide reductase accessory protein NosL [Thioalkalivibrio nitratireducens]|nr:nitrous oxide reductase accessory protein NosL [Thioalkalivibrio nitratireducens]
MNRYRRLTLRAAGLVVLSAAGCTGETQDAGPLLPIEIGRGDFCHVCGMTILEYPGPKGQVHELRRERPLLFCSTSDLFAYLLQPETAARVREIHVQDMGGRDWQEPGPGPQGFVDAQDAWYVAGHSRMGAMGPTLASFSAETSAQTFAEEYGGRLLRFPEIDLDVLRSLRGATHPPRRHG